MIFIPEKISRDWLINNLDGKTEPSHDNMKTMEYFCLEMWQKRASEYKFEHPGDLTNSCKFTSLFLRSLIGGEIAGNERHQFVILDDEIFDLNKNSEDVKLIDEPYFEDFYFIGNPEHLESLESCIPRVNNWLEIFQERYPSLVKTNRETPKI